jgi:hypothetical protein
MDFEIPEPLVRALHGMLEPESRLAKQLNEHGICHGNMVVSSKLFDAHSLHTLYSLSKEQNERALMFQMLALDNVYNAPDARTIPSLEQLVPGLVAYLSRDAIDGWLYRRNRDGTLVPWLVERLRYVEPEQGRPYVVVHMLANTMQSANSERTEHRHRQPDHPRTAGRVRVLQGVRGIQGRIRTARPALLEIPAAVWRAVRRHQSRVCG